MTKRTFMIIDNDDNGHILARNLNIQDALILLELLATHNGISAWTLATDYIEEDGARCAPKQEED